MGFREFYIEGVYVYWVYVYWVMRVMRGFSKLIRKGVFLYIWNKVFGGK